MAEDCRACGGAGTVATDPFSGLFCCCECGVVVDDDVLASQHQVGLIGERGGTLVSGNGIGYSALPGRRSIHIGGGSEQYFAKKKQDALQRIRDMASALRLQPNDADDLEALVDRTTSGEWGSGRWFSVLVGACAYIVVRKNRLPFTLVEVAYVTDCGVPELGRVLSRVLKELEMPLPQEDSIVFLERLVLTHTAFSKLSREHAKKIVGQCGVLLEWVETWFVTTGRHSLPVAAAVLFVATEANRIKIGLEEISDELHANVRTSTKRYREIKEGLVKTMETLPLCKGGVTTKNISCHLGFMLRFLEMSLRLGKKRKRDSDEQQQQATNSSSSPTERLPIEDHPGHCSKKLRHHASEESPVLPTSFAASESSRCRRIVKAELAAQRIVEAKRCLCKGAADDPQVQQDGLDWEDLTIEYLMLRGVTRDQIEQGYYDTLMADLAPRDDDQDISDEELAKYLYTKDEISLLVQRVKLQNMMRGLKSPL